MQDRPRISAVVCTYERPEYLRLVLRSLLSQDLPQDWYEIVVVDNGITATTRSMVVSEFSGRPNVVYYREARVGLSAARNAGIQCARGECVAYLDDDCLPCRAWLERILQAFDEHDAMTVGVGGPISLKWEADRPSWVHDELLTYLGNCSHGDRPLFLQEGRYLAGGNMAFRRTSLLETNGFSERLGKVGESGYAFEENGLQEYLRRRGYRILYDPRITAEHHVPAEKLRPGWFLRRSYCDGRSEARMLSLADGGKNSRWQLAKNSVKPWAKQVAKHALFRKENDLGGLFATLCDGARSLGFCREAMFNRLHASP